MILKFINNSSLLSQGNFVQLLLISYWQSPDGHATTNQGALFDILSFFLGHCIFTYLIAIYLWLGFIRDTTESQFVFCGKITWNSIFGAINCR